MTHNISLITTLAAGFGLALLFGFIAERIKLPALVGYLFAGIIIGPATPGFVADMAIASQLAEIGVMLMMFGVGLHFSLDDLLVVKRIAIPGAVLQMGITTLLGTGLAIWWGWDVTTGLIFGMSLSCASTVVLLRALDRSGALDTINGHIAIGWVVVQDLVTVLVLVLLPAIANMSATAPSFDASSSLWIIIGQSLIQIIAFIALMLIVGRRLMPWMLWQIARTGSRELFTLSIVSSAIGIAYGAAELFKVSFALGAFFAGTVMRESEFSHRAAEESLPFRDAFAVLFFVSVGMLFNPAILTEQPVHLIGTVLIILVGTPVMAMLLILAMQYPLNTAITVAANLAQIGEFSFILSGLGLSLGLLPADGFSLILASALISIALNPLIIASTTPLRNWALKRSGLARRLEHRQDPFAELPMSTEKKYLEGQVVLVGYGRVGRRIGEALAERGIPYVVVEQIREQVEGLRKQGIAAVSGNAADPIVLVQAHIATAAMLVIAIPDPIGVGQMIDTARTLNPGIEIVLRTHSEYETQLMRNDRVGSVFFGEEELAKGMTSHVVQRFSR